MLNYYYSSKHLKFIGLNTLNLIINGIDKHIIRQLDFLLVNFGSLVVFKIVEVVKTTTEQLYFPFFNQTFHLFGMVEPLLIIAFFSMHLIRRVKWIFLILTIKYKHCFLLRIPVNAKIEWAAFAFIRKFYAITDKRLSCILTDFYNLIGR